LNDRNLAQHVQQPSDKAAPKVVVDTFSTEDATVELISEGPPGNLLKGRKQLADAFGAFLARMRGSYGTGRDGGVGEIGDTRRKSNLDDRLDIKSA
jgi:hypothetical protein